MTNEININSETYWKKKIKENWILFTFALILLLFFIGIGVYIFINYLNVTYPNTTFNEWSLSWVVNFFIGLIKKEIVVILPTILSFGIGGYLWWKQLPEDEQKLFNSKKKKHNKGRDTAGGGSLFMFIGYCVYMAYKGYYYTPFGDQPYSFWVLSYVQMISWLLIIFGIPGSIIGLIFLVYWLNKDSK